MAPRPTPAHLPSRLDPVIDGVELQRVIVMPRSPRGRLQGVCLASIPQEIWLDLCAGLDWRPDTPGALNLAACILDRYLPARPGEVAEWDGRPVACRQLVADLAVDFAGQVLAGVPYWGGIVDRRTIIDWLGGRPECEPEGIDLAAPLEDLP